MLKRKKISKMLCIILAFVLLMPVLSVNESKAAGFIKCYTIYNGNTTVYTSSSLRTKLGTIFASDELRILEIQKNYVKVTYPISRGTKTGYIPTSAVLLATGGYRKTATRNITTYKRNSTSYYYGYIAKGDKVNVLGSRGNFTQVCYPVSGGNKIGWIRTSDASALSSGLLGLLPSISLGITSPVPSGCKFSQKTWDGSWYGYHDINRNVSSSTPVYAIADGVVTYKQAYRTYNGIKYLTSYGNFIEFRSSQNGYTAKYCHLSRFRGANQIISSSRTRRVSGSTGTYTIATRNVKKGEIIGYIGTTGNSSGNHLHFELRKNGSRIDPTSVIKGLV